MERVKEIVGEGLRGQGRLHRAERQDHDFGDPVFKPYVIREINGVPCAIIGQAFPYTPIANPRYLVADWSFGIQDRDMQKMVDEARAKGAQVVVLLSHNGMDVDLKLAGRVQRHRRDPGRPHARRHAGRHAGGQPGGKTIVTNAGSNGKFLGVMDFDVKDGKAADFRYRLLPVFANMLPADRRWTR
jgi:sulfur-oxidizing protein SoxB